AFLTVLFLILTLRKKKQLKDFTEVLAKINEAKNRLEYLTDFNRYFCNYDKENFKKTYRDIFNEVRDENKYKHLNTAEKIEIQNFKTNYQTIEAIVGRYNPEFIDREKEQHKSLFDYLESHPLSDDQRTAIITDEDNNLVIAGAGTGKTTTIAGKVAYIIDKKLANPNEILVISFTKSAVNEMGKRIKNYLKEDELVQNLKIKTFNSYGFEVVRTMQIHRNLGVAFENEEQLFSFLQTLFDDLFLNDGDFSKKATNFLAFFSRPERDDFDFETGDEYYKHEKSFKNVGFDGAHYKSKEEVEIANFLLLSGVSYEYEKFYPLKIEDKNPIYGSYQPDFYLPKYEIYIEHYGIDENGNVPEYFSGNVTQSARERYHNGMLWKQQIHEKYGTNLVTTYSYENRQGILIKKLSEKLSKKGVEFVKKTPGEILDIIKEQDTYKEFNKLISTFLGLMKSNKYQPNDVLHKNNDKRLKVFIDVFKPIYAKYEEHLRSKSLLDFNDMINVASDGINDNSYKHPFKYILIDEFQDMSLNRYQLLKAMKSQNPSVKIYAVGDDWQSIFRFSGSDISLLTQFKKYFGYSKYTQILNTYRFNTEILNITSGFIQKNDAQLKKNLTALSEPLAPSFEFIGLNMNGLDGTERVNLSRTSVRKILARLNVNALAVTKVFLIGRYHFNNPKIGNEFANLDINFYTAHSVKGLTCDYAILLDVNSGVLGFPSEIVDDPILEYLLHEGDRYENSEERRLFYVANTRARHKNFIIYDIYNESKFVKELRIDYQMANTETELKVCKLCKGLMVERISNHGKFYGCSNYPNCKGTMVA
ncbi:hypothetical protein EON78_00905, partial [bacterium]